MKSREEDRRAVHRCLHGEPEAYRELVDRYKNQVFSLILRLVQNPADAEDIAQNVFIKAYRNLDSYDPERPFLTWLFKIAHNASIDFLRLRRPESVSIDDEERPFDAPEPGLVGGPMEAVLQELWLDRLLAGLPPLYREVVLLRHQLELDVKEIAQVLEIPEGTVKIRLFRARELLRKAMEHETERTAQP